MSFDKNSAKRVANATRQFENQYKRTAPQVSGPQPFFGKKYARTTSVITAKDGTTLGIGTGKLQLVTGRTMSDMSYPDISILSAASEDIDSGRLIQVCVIDGAWNIDVDYC